MKAVIRLPKHPTLGATLLVAAVAGASIFKMPAASAPAERPNIVFILADDVGREAIQCYGGESYPTPEVDRLAAQGMRFDHVYSAPVCHPTRTTLLTGRYPVHLGYPAWGSFPKAFEPQTLGRLLQRAGYATAIAGKWQLTLLKGDLEHPHRLGFDTYCLFGWHEGPRYHQPYIWQDGRRRTDVSDRYGPDVYVEFLIDFIQRHRDRPFFAFYSMALCHAVSDDFKPPPPYGPHGRYETFAEMMAEMDKRVGRIVAAVDKLGLAERTLILFTTDNGSPSSNFLKYENGRFTREKVVSRWKGRQVPGGKGKVSDWGIRVPTIARWPGHIAPGSVSDALIDFSDVLPTFCELAGAPLPDAPIDGRSFAGVLRRGDRGVRNWVFSQSKPNSYCIRSRHWKLRHDGKLFHIPGEADTEQLVSPEEQTDKAARARAELAAQLRKIVGR